MKTKTLLLSVLLLIGLFATFGCAETQLETSATTTAATTAADEDATGSEQTDATEPENVQLSGNLTLIGSTSMADVSNALAEAFRNHHPDLSISVGGNGSGEGPVSVENGSADIGLVSREVRDTENPDDMNMYIMAFDGIALIVHPDSQIDSLTQEQAAAIYKGEIVNWSEVGGEDMPIHVIGREAASGTRGAFEEIIGVKDECQYTEEHNSTGSVKQSVASNPNAIGYVSLSAIDDTVKALAYNDVAPTVENVTSGAYSLQRPFVMVTWAASESENASAFMAFVYSEEGSQIISDDGLVPNA